MALEKQVVPIRSEPVPINDVPRVEGRTLRQAFLTYEVAPAEKEVDEKRNGLTGRENTAPTDPTMWTKKKYSGYCVRVARQVMLPPNSETPVMVAYSMEGLVYIRSHPICRAQIIP